MFHSLRWQRSTIVSALSKLTLPAVALTSLALASPSLAAAKTITRGDAFRSARSPV